MTTTLSPSDTGDIAAAPPIPFIEGLPLRPVGAAELERLSAGETLILPVDAVPSVPRTAAPTVYQPQVRPDRYRGKHRKARSARSWAVLVAGALLLAEAAVLAVLAVLVVAW